MIYPRHGRTQYWCYHDNCGRWDTSPDRVRQKPQHRAGDELHYTSGLVKLKLHHASKGKILQKRYKMDRKIKL